MVRPICCRQIANLPDCSVFKPAGVPSAEFQTGELFFGRPLAGG